MTSQHEDLIALNALLAGVADFLRGADLGVDAAAIDAAIRVLGAQGTELDRLRKRCAELEAQSRVVGDVPNTQALTPVERLRIMAFHLGPAEHDELLGIAAEIEAASVTGEHPSDDLIRFMQRVQLEAWPATEADVPLFTEERLIDRIRELAQGTELDRLRNENAALRRELQFHVRWHEMGGES